RREWIVKPKPGWASLLIDGSATMEEDVPTYKRFQQLREEDPDAEYTFVTGSDAVTPNSLGVFPIDTWQEAHLLRQDNILIVPRWGFAQPGDIELPKNMKWLNI